jgi:cyanosortase A-associated protein
VKEIMFWKKLRIPILSVTFASTLLVLGKVIFPPNQNKSTIATFVFPKEVPLSEWELVSTLPIPMPTQPNPELIAAHHYRYIQKNQHLDIKMRYLTLFDVNELIKNYTSISSPPIVRQREAIGYYGLGIDGEKAYLSACINPWGGSTFTGEQFQQNQYWSDLEPQRVLSWLIGNERTKDNRCLWAHLSVPLKDSSKETAYQILESAWVNWYQWWLPRFPKR